MQNIGIMTAMSSEYNAIVKSLNKLIKGEIEQTKKYKIFISSYQDKKIIVIRTGVGYKKARDAISFLLKNYDISFILNIGMAGAINPSLNIGDLLICKDFIFEKKPKDIINSDYNNNSDIKNLCTQRRSTYSEGRIITVERPLSDNSKRSFFFDNYHADTVDMESYVIVEKCINENIPFAVIKSISDMADDKINIFNLLFDSNGNFLISQLIKFIFIHPVKFWNLFKNLYKDSRKALLTIQTFTNFFIENFIKYITEVK